jgi:hypothetical protein
VLFATEQHVSRDGPVEASAESTIAAEPGHLSPVFGAPVQQEGAEEYIAEDGQPT